MIKIKTLIKNKKTYNKLIKLKKKPQCLGICHSLDIMSPKKPNSALRKIAKIKINNNKIIKAYIPGEGPSIKEYNFVLICPSKCPDLPGINYKIIRGAKDAKCVKHRKTSRSKYGTKKYTN